jgi:hypothetical protein
MVIRSNGKIALQATGAADLTLGSGFASASAETVGIAFNNTGSSIDRILTVTVAAAPVTAPLKVNQGVSALLLNGFQATVGGFVSISGNFALQKTTGATPAEDEFVVVSQAASASLRAGDSIRVGVQGATMALLLRGDQTMGLQARGSVELSLGAGFASASAEDIAVVYNNTGADLDRDLTVSMGSAVVTAPLRVANNTASVAVNGLMASMGGFATLRGDFAFAKQESDIQVVARGASALLTAGEVNIGVAEAD